MTLGDLIDAFRTRTDDIEEPFLWSDDEATLYANEAVKEAAERARLIPDATTLAVTQLAINTTDTDYALHPSILHVERAKLDSQTRPLSRATVGQLDRDYPDWEAQTGPPVYFVEDNGRIRLVPKSAATDTLTLVVYRLPLADMAAVTDEPGIHARHHYRLVDWMLRCAYLKQDAEARDEQKAAQYEAMFEQSFGKRPDANVQRKQRENRATTVNINW